MSELPRMSSFKLTNFMDSSNPDAFSQKSPARQSSEVNVGSAGETETSSKRTLPGGEVGSLEEGMLENTLDSTQRGDNVDTVVVDCRGRG